MSKAIVKDIVELQVLGLGLGVDFVFPLSQEQQEQQQEQEQDPHLNFLKGTEQEKRNKGLGLRVQG